MNGDMILLYLIGAVFLSCGMATYLNNNGIGGMCFGICAIVATIIAPLLWRSKSK